MNNKSRFLLITLISGFVGTVGIGTIPALAGQNPPQKQERVDTQPITQTSSITAEATDVERPVPELVVAGHVVMRLRSRAGGLTPAERAYDLRQRLGPILTLPNITAEDVEIRQRRPGQTASIYVRQRLLVTVDRNLAQANNTSISGLAEQWAKNLRATLPQVNVAVRLSRGTSWQLSSGNSNNSAKSADALD